MSEFERGSWAAISVAMAVLTVALLVTGSDEWPDGLTVTFLTAYIVGLGKRTRSEATR